MDRLAVPSRDAFGVALVPSALLAHRFCGAVLFVMCNLAFARKLLLLSHVWSLGSFLRVPVLCANASSLHWTGIHSLGKLLDMAIM